MSLLIALLVGAVVGLALGYWLLDNYDFLLLNILMGVVGSIIGLGIYYFGLRDTNDDSLFNMVGLLCSIIGALLAVLIFDGLHHVAPKHGVDNLLDNRGSEEPESKKLNS